MKPTEEVDRAMQLAQECAHKMATPANWHALRAHLEAMAAARTMPTANPGQCPMCGEYSMSARAHQGLYGHKVDLDA